jgi:hypothetical protein
MAERASKSRLPFFVCSMLLRHLSNHFTKRQRLVSSSLHLVNSQLTQACYRMASINLAMFRPRISGIYQQTAIKLPHKPILETKSCPCGWQGTVASDLVVCPRCRQMFSENQRKQDELARELRKREKQREEKQQKQRNQQNQQNQEEATDTMDLEESRQGNI